MSSQSCEDQNASPSKLSKEELIQSMDRVDREIAKVEQQILKLKKKQVSCHGSGTAGHAFWLGSVTEKGEGLDYPGVGLEAE